MKNGNEILALAANLYASHLALDLTAGRTRALVAAGVGLVSLIIGALALARSGRTLGIVALILGLISMVLCVVHLGTATGGFGSGSGRAGAIVGLVLGLIGVILGGVVWARTRRA